MPSAISSRTPTTSESLLRELADNPDSPRAEEFARLYVPVLRRYIERSRAGRDAVQPTDRDDLAQEIFLAVRSAIPGLRRDRSRESFRAYLRRTVRNALFRFRRRRVDIPIPISDDTPDPSATNDDSGELLPQIWTLAMVRINRSGRFSPNTLAAFRRLAIEGIPVAVVSREFGLKPNALYQIKNRILRAIRDELARFGGGRSSPEELLDALLDAERKGK